MNEQCIQVNNLTKSFSGRKVINDLSFEVNKGEVFALIGHNGAGKSTTIDLILGLKCPDEGNATILGMDAVKHRKKVFEKVGVQLQHTEYQNMMTVEEACLEKNTTKVRNFKSYLLASLFNAGSRDIWSFYFPKWS